MTPFAPPPILRAALACLLFAQSGAFGLAQSSGGLSPSHQDVARLVHGATRELLLCVPSLRSRVIAEALREAMRVRGVRVYIVASPAGTQERASYLASLRLAGANVRLAYTPASFLLIDRKQLVTGGLLGSRDRTPGREPARLQTSAAAIHRHARWFTDAYRAASPYDPLSFLLGGAR